MFGVVDEGNWVLCEQLPAAGDAVDETPRLTVDRSCPETEEEDDPTDSTEPEETDTSSAEPEEMDETTARR